MIQKKKLISIMFFTLLFGSVFSQYTVDTVNLSLGLKDRGLFSEMYAVLSEYRKAHPNDENIEWLYGQVACFTGRTKEMITVYEKNIKQHPHNKFLQLDYAFKLAEAGKLNRAKPLLEQQLNVRGANYKIYEYLAKIHYWQLDLQKADEYIQEAQKLAPDDAHIAQLAREIQLAWSVYGYFSHSSFEDDQPIAKQKQCLMLGKQLHPLLKPELEFDYGSLDTSGLSLKTPSLSLTNTAYFAQLGVFVSMSTGLFKFPHAEPAFIWGAAVKRTFLKYITADLKLDRTPYLLMKTALDTAMITTDVWSGISYSKPDGFMGQVGYQASFFADKNEISTALGWLISPPIELWEIKLRTGYGYSYTNSKKDRFAQIKTDDELFFDIFFDESVAGQFTHYMTPMHQSVHSFVGVAAGKLFPFLNISLSVSYGFKASIETPYLFGYYDKDFSVIVDRAYYSENFNPFELNVQAQLRIADFARLSVAYKKSTPNYYYNSKQLEIGLLFQLAGKASKYERATEY